MGQGVKVSDSVVTSGDEGVLEATGGCVGVKVAITVGVSSTDRVSVAEDGVTVSVDDGVRVVSRSENNQ